MVEGKKKLDDSRNKANNNKRNHKNAKGGGNGKVNPQSEAWKKNMKKAIKTRNGFSNIMSILTDEVTRNKSNLPLLQPSTPIISNTSIGSSTATVIDTYTTPVVDICATASASSQLLQLNSCYNFDAKYHSQQR